MGLLSSLISLGLRLLEMMFLNVFKMGYKIRTVLNASKRGCQIRMFLSALKRGNRRNRTEEPSGPLGVVLPKTARIMLMFR